MKTIDKCPDCEPAQVNHFIMRTGAYMSLAFKPMLKPFDYFVRVVLPPSSFSWFDKIGPLVLRTLAFFRIGRFYSKVSDNDSDRTRALWNEAERRGIQMREYKFGPVKDLFIAKKDGRVRCFDGLPRPVGPEASSLFWMDNKPVMRKVFESADIPIARGGSRFFLTAGLELYRSLRKPVIAKPYSGSRSRHTTIHIDTEEKFTEAFRKAKVLSPKVLIEEELKGFVFRGTLIGGKLVAVMRREPPHVIGDGKSTVAELIRVENSRPERHGPTFHELALGPEAEEELRRQGLNLQSVPAVGQFVSLNQKVSRGIGASTTDVTDSVHPENLAMFEKIGTVLKDPLVGVDFIIGDMSKSWKEQERSGVIECNSLPFIDLHHYPLNGKPRNVAGALWDLIFPDSAGQKT